MEGAQIYDIPLKCSMCRGKTSPTWCWKDLVLCGDCLLKMWLQVMMARNENAKNNLLWICTALVSSEIRTDEVNEVLPQCSEDSDTTSLDSEDPAS